MIKPGTRGFVCGVPVTVRALGSHALKGDVFLVRGEPKLVDGCWMRELFTIAREHFTPAKHDTPEGNEFEGHR